MSYFMLNALTGTIAAGAGTAGCIAAAVGNEKTKVKNAALQAIEEVQSHTKKAEFPLEGRTIFAVQNLPEIPALLMDMQINLQQRSKMNKEFMNAAIEGLKRTGKACVSIMALKPHVILGASLIVVPTLTALHYLKGEESKHAMELLFEKGYLGISLGTQMAVVFIDLFQRGETPESRLILSNLHGVLVGTLEYITSRTIAPRMGAAATSTALIFKTVETMGDAAEGYGGFILASAGGTAAAAVIAVASKKIEEQGGDKRVATWACSAAMCLWIAMLYSDLLDPENMSVSDALSTWAAISLLSGLISAIIAQALPRAH